FPPRFEHKKPRILPGAGFGLSFNMWTRALTRTSAGNEENKYEFEGRSLRTRRQRRRAGQSGPVGKGHVLTRVLRHAANSTAAFQSLSINRCQTFLYIIITLGNIQSGQHPLTYY